MLEAGPALKVTIYLNCDTGAERGFLVDDIFAFLRRSGIEGATAIKAYAGFGSHGRLHTSGAGDVQGQHLPILIYFIEKEQKVKAVLDELLSMVSDGLVEAHPTNVLRNITASEKVIS